MDAEDNQIFEKQLKKAQAAQADGKWYTPVPDDWLGKKRWSVQDALLLFAGLNPLIRDIAWESDGYPVRLSRVERIGREINDPSTYSMMSRKELETEVRSIRKAARDRFNEVRSEDLPEVHSLETWKDNDADSECKKWLRCYEESEDLLAHFLKKWRESKDEEISERLPPQTFIGWASDQGLTDKIPWWPEFIGSGSLTRFLDTKKCCDPGSQLNEVEDNSEDRKARAIKETQKAGYDPFEKIRGWKNLENATGRSRNHLKKLCPYILRHDIPKEDKDNPQSQVWLFKHETSLLTSPRPIKRNRQKK